MLILTQLLHQLLLKVLRDDGQKIQGIYERNDIQVRSKEGLSLYKGFWKNAKMSTTTVINENGLLLNVDVENGQKTGYFLDQKSNRVLLRQRKTQIYQSEDIVFDMDKMEVKKAGNAIVLSALEMKILTLLFENRNKVVSRNAVIDCIWDATGNDVYDHTVTVYIKRIRQKLGTDIITTIKGVGYRVDAKEL